MLRSVPVGAGPLQNSRLHHTYASQKRVLDAPQMNYEKLFIVI